MSTSPPPAQRATVAARSARALGLPALAGHSGLVVALAVDSVGTGLYFPISLLYFTVVARLPLVAVGATLSVATFVTMPLPGLVGWLVDRAGARRVVIAAEVLQAGGFAGYLAVGNVPGLFVAALAVTAGLRLFWSSLFTLVSDAVEPGERDSWFGLVGMTQSAGIGVGTLAAGALLSLGGRLPYEIAVAADAASFALTAVVLVARVPEPPGGRHRHAARTPGARPVWRDAPFLALVAVETVMALCVVMLTVGVPVYVEGALHAPAWTLGPLLALATLILALGQGIVVKVSVGRRRTRALALAAVVWAVWSAGMAAVGPLRGPWLLVALFGLIALYGLADVTHAPLSNSLAAGAAPPESRGRYLGTFQYSYALASALAPAMFTALFALDPALPWEALAALALVAAGGLVALERRLPPAAIRGRAVATRRSGADDGPGEAGGDLRR